MLELIISKLEQNHAHFRIIQHTPEGQSDRVCKIRGNTLHQGAKAILLRLAITKKTSRYLLAVLPADMSVAFAEIARIFSAKNVMMAPVDKVKELTGCEVGAVPPFVFNPDIKIVVDNALVDDNEEIAFNAGRLDTSIIMRAEDYRRIILAEGGQLLPFGVRQKTTALTPAFDAAKTAEEEGAPTDASSETSKKELMRPTI